MIPFLNSISYSKALVSTLCFIALFGFVLSFQGFDVCDEGLALTVYQQVFNCPSCIEFNFYRWFAAIIGGLWYLLFPNGGIWSFRILTIISFLISGFLVFKLFKPYLKPYQIAIGVIVSVFISDFGYLVFYHNHLTIILNILIVCFMHRGIVKKNVVFLSISGFITVFCVLSRIPNLTLLALVIAFFYPLFDKEELNNKKVLIFKYFKFYSIGIVIGISCFLIAAFALNHQESLLNSLYSTIGHGTASDGNHNIWTLLKVFIRCYVIVILAGARYVLVAVAFLGLYSGFKNKFLRIVLCVSLLAAFIIFFKNQDIFKVYFLIFLGNALLLLNKHVTPSLKLLSVMSLTVAMVLPLGSDGALYNMGYVSIWLAMPLSVGALSGFKWNSHKLFKFKKLNFNIEKRAFSLLFVVTLFGYSLSKINKISNEAYFDVGSRLQKKYAINHPLAKNVYTTKERSIIINDLLVQLNQYVEPDEYLLAYDKIPMVHYLTQTKPYMSTPWVWVYSGEMFEDKLQEAEKEIPNLPIVVQQKFETIMSFSEPIEDYMSENKTENNLHSNARSKAMNSFLIRNNYTSVWSNDYFVIYRPEQKL